MSQISTEIDYDTLDGLREVIDNDSISFGYIVKCLEMRLIQEQNLDIINRDPKQRNLERQLADELYDHLMTILDDHRILSEETLDYCPPADSTGASSHESDSQASSNDYWEPESEPDSFDYGALTPEQHRQVCLYIIDHPKHGWSTLKNRFTFLRPFSESLFYKLRLHARNDSSETYAEKLTILHENLWEQFETSRGRFETVSDHDLTQWAKMIAQDLGLTSFKSSASFIYRWKLRNNVCSRKVTKFVSHRNVLTQEQKRIEAERFASKVKAIIQTEGIAHKNVFNADQTGMPYEIYSNRTLSHRGERSTFSHVQSMSSTKHSFTAMVLISADDKLADKTLLCLQEIGGRFGPEVERRLYRPPNIALTCTRSGLSTDSTYKWWVDTVLANNIRPDQKSLFIADSWAPHRNVENYEALVSHGDEFRYEIIPPQTTSMCQPLDVYFNRQLKNLDRMITHPLRTKFGQRHSVFQRNTAIRIMSLIQFSLSAPIFEPMIRYSFLKSGLIDQEREEFKSANQVCRVQSVATCYNFACDERVDMRCAWCANSFCILCMLGLGSEGLHMDSCNIYADRSSSVQPMELDD